MKTKDLWQQYEFFTNTYSTIARQLAFAAVAICWIFRIDNDNRLPNIILFSLFLILLFFTLDLAQYFFAARITKKIAFEWEELAKKELTEGKLIKLEDFDKKMDNKKLLPLLYIYNVKGAILVIAYIIIVAYYVWQLLFGN
jgi:hypothetical protein